MFKKMLLKDKLMNCFRTGELCNETKRNGKTLRKFPNIVEIRPGEDKNVFVFRLPPGLNPAEIKKKEYVFHSYFGQNVDLKGENGIYSLTVYSEVQDNKFAYSFEELQKVMKKHNLPIIAGKDRNGKMYSYDMTENPHLLIAGETGSGKSVMLRSVITSLIQHKRKGLQLHLADLKRSEFHLFRNVDVVKAMMTKKDDVIKCIKWYHKQLTVRGDLLDLHEVSHIDKYNKLDGVEKQDYLMLCIDEFSLLRNEIDAIDKLVDIAALGRALGVYLILSTQRPDRNIVDGLMKANMTMRYAFKHVDKVNSRITLGENSPVDASKIDKDDKGKFYITGFEYPLLQSPFLDEEVAKEILEPFKERKYEPSERETVADVEYKEEDAHTEDFAPLLMLEEGEDERTRQGDN
ncbi:MAG: FtsK/SpoIIIE domain-containing protein [Bacillota bacterium]